MKGASKIGSSKFPWTVTTNRKDSLRLVLQSKNEQILKLYQAFSIHSPDEPPLFMNKEVFIEYDGGKKLQIFITPNVITTDKNLKTLSIEDRVCFLDGEKYLRFFKVYTTKNCKVECFANISSEVCGCVPFDVIRDSDMPVCELHDYPCLLDLEYELKFFENSEKSKSCNCLQSCNSISYDFEFIENRLEAK